MTKHHIRSLAMVVALICSCTQRFGELEGTGTGEDGTDGTGGEDADGSGSDGGTSGSDGGTGGTDGGTGGSASGDGGTGDSCEKQIYEGDFFYEGGGSLTELQGVTHVTGNVEILGLQGPDLTVLRCLEDVNGAFTISENPNLTSMHGLENLRIVASSLFIRDNAKLQSLEGFDRLKSIEALNLENNPVISTMRGMNRLEVCHQDFETHGNPKLTDLDDVTPGLGGSLQSAGNLFVSTQPKMPVCAFEYLRDSIDVGESDAHGLLDCPCDGPVCQ
jgi:hypothetical protein